MEGSKDGAYPFKKKKKKTQEMERMMYRNDEDARWYRCTHPSKIRSPCSVHSAKPEQQEEK